jgi:hypothetical protein
MPALNELGPAQRFFIVRILPWFIIFAGGASIYLGVDSVLKAQQSTDWPSVKGRIVESGIRTQSGSTSKVSRVTYHANVVYEYDVIGKVYTGHRVSFGEYGTGDGIHANEIIKRYPQGENVNVFYDPDQHSVSVLEPGSHGVPWFFLALGFPFLLFGGALAYFLPKQAGKIN